MQHFRFRFRSSIFLLFLLLSCLLPQSATAASANLRWKANPEADLAGYNIYYGTASRMYGPAISIGAVSGYTIDNLQDDRLYYFSLTARDSAGNESGYSAEVAFRTAAAIPEPEPEPDPITEPDPVPAELAVIPGSGSYGYIRQGDRSNVNDMTYHFAGVAGDVLLKYEVYDVSDATEIEILLNGQRIGYAAITANNKWSGVRTLVLPDAIVSDDSENVLVFDNTYNPTKTAWWGVGNVSIELKPDVLAYQ